jgi:hypothetical protein
VQTNDESSVVLEEYQADKLQRPGAGSGLWEEIYNDTTMLQSASELQTA